MSFHSRAGMATVRSAASTACGRPAPATSAPWDRLTCFIAARYSRTQLQNWALDTPDLRASTAHTDSAWSCTAAKHACIKRRRDFGTGRASTPESAHNASAVKPHASGSAAEDARTAGEAHSATDTRSRFNAVACTCWTTAAAVAADGFDPDTLRGCKHQHIHTHIHIHIHIHMHMHMHMHIQSSSSRSHVTPNTRLHAQVKGLTQLKHRHRQQQGRRRRRRLPPLRTLL